MPAVTANLVQYTGEDRVYQDTIYRADGTPADITGWSVTFAVHIYGDPSSVYFSKTVVAGITLSSPTTGVMLIGVSAADTINMFPGEYEFCVTRTDTGVLTVLTRGCFTLLSQ